jgi:hypothetical protein
MLNVKLIILDVLLLLHKLLVQKRKQFVQQNSLLPAIILNLQLVFVFGIALPQVVLVDALQ